MCATSYKEGERGGGVYINKDLARTSASVSPPTNLSALSADALPVVLTLPWPPTTLSPNTRHGHWSTLARAKKRFRAACATTAQAQGARPLAGLIGGLLVNLRFIPPDRRHRDLDNCIASMKSGLDGLADVLQVDDSRWRLSCEMVAGEIGGMVKVEVVVC